MRPSALLEAPTGSRGIPTKLVSSLPFAFASCHTDRAYVPAGKSVNVHWACNAPGGTTCALMARCASFGNPSAEEKSRQWTAPVSDVRPEISNVTRSACALGCMPRTKNAMMSALRLYTAVG